MNFTIFNVRTIGEFKEYNLNDQNTHNKLRASLTNHGKISEADRQILIVFRSHDAKRLLGYTIINDIINKLSYTDTVNLYLEHNNIGVGEDNLNLSEDESFDIAHFIEMIKECRTLASSKIEENRLMEKFIENFNLEYKIIERN